MRACGRLKDWQKACDQSSNLCGPTHKVFILPRAYIIMLKKLKSFFKEASWHRYFGLVLLVCSAPLIILFGTIGVIFAFGAIDSGYFHILDLIEPAILWTNSLIILTICILFIKLGVKESSHQGPKSAAAVLIVTSIIILFCGLYSEKLIGSSPHSGMVGFF